MSLWFYVTKRTMGCHMYDPFLQNQLLPLKTLKKCIFLIFDQFWTFQMTMSALSSGQHFILRPQPERRHFEWDRGDWNTMCSVTGLSTLHWHWTRPKFFLSPNVGGKISFTLNFKFAFTIGVTTAITIQQSFWILCNKCKTSAFETQVQLNSLTLWMTNIWVKKGLLGGYKGPEARLF